MDTVVYSFYLDNCDNCVQTEGAQYWAALSALSFHYPRYIVGKIDFKCCYTIIIVIIIIIYSIYIAPDP